MLQRQVTTAGRVHYSRPAQPYDIKADLEVEYSPSLLAAKLRLAFAKGSGRKLGSASPVLALSADVLEKVAARSAASNWVLSQPGFGTVHARTGSSLADSPDVVVNSVKTLMFRVAERVPPSESVLEPLAVLASRCPRLEEIHYVEDLGARRDMTAVIEDLLHEAPHLRATLKLLRLGGTDLCPDELGSLAGFASMERLDLTNCFTSEYYDFDGGCYEIEEPEHHPYDLSLHKVVKSMRNLQQLDLGYGDQDMVRYFWDYCVSRHGMQRVQRARPGLDVTMESARGGPIPHRWPGGNAQESEARDASLRALLEGEDVRDTLSETRRHFG